MYCGMNYIGVELLSNNQEIGVYMIYKWEYLVIQLPRQIEDAKAELNFRGQDGWELISVVSDDSGRVAYFKRQERGDGLVNV